MQLNYMIDRVFTHHGIGLHSATLTTSLHAHCDTTFTKYKDFSQVNQPCKAIINLQLT